jgi:Flp pilus assembly protein TadD
MNGNVVRPLRVKKSVFAALALLLSQAALAEVPAQELLQEQLHELSQRSLRSMAGENLRRCQDFSDTQGMLAAMERAGSLLPAACLVTTIEDQGLSAVDGSLDAVAQYLLNYGLVGPVDRFLHLARTEGRQADQATLGFWLAQYALEGNDWALAQARKSQIPARYSLSAHQQDHLALMRGVLWQLNREQRRAITLYENYSRNSELYPVARANLALAYLSQGWWTDAYREIDQLLELPLEQEFHNRLRIIKGLSQLQQGFYRHARETFRSLDRDSRYVARAWLGIGLTALHLEDYAGALNAFQQARTAPGDTMEESAFLVAYTFDQMGDLMLAEASYTEAMIHYQNQVNRYNARLEELAQGNLPDDLTAAFDSMPSMPILGRKAEYSTPPMVTQYLLVKRLADQVSDHAVQIELSNLRDLQRQVLAHQLSEQYQRRLEYAQSYLSQCQYGLATIYDRQK